jgi:tetratricopeptide (TPR) repeat protein
MKSVPAFLILLLAGFHLTVPLAAQVTYQPPSPFQPALRQWADPETVEQWTQAIHQGSRLSEENRLDEAATFFRQAVALCERKAPESVHECLSRLLLSEVLLGKGNTEDATIQVNQLVMSLKKATRAPDSAKGNHPKRNFEEAIANVYRYQVGAALYLRAARLYCRLGNPRLAEPLFKAAIQVFEQPIHPHAFLLFGQGNMLITQSGDGQRNPTFYPQRSLRVAEILEAQCRFNLVFGRDALALTQLQEAEKARKKKPPLDQAGRPVRQSEPFVDQLVAEPLDKSALKRMLEDCAFYRFDDARIADLLVRQAVLLKKVGRADEATAFERFAQSLRQPRLAP